MTVLSFLTWMDNLPSSIALRESTWTYPIVESVHSVGICLFVGLTLLWDLRLLGIGLRRVPVSEVWNKLIPWMTLGALIPGFVGEKMGRSFTYQIQLLIFGMA